VRWFRLILALYVFVWFNVVVPGHTRGIVTVPGSEPNAKSVQTDSCCSTGKTPTKDGKPTPDQQKRCGVCFVAATYTVPVIHRFFVDLLELTSIVNDRATSQLLRLRFPTPFWPIGPPASA